MVLEVGRSRHRRCEPPRERGSWGNSAAADKIQRSDLNDLFRKLQRLRGLLLLAQDTGCVGPPAHIPFKGAFSRHSSRFFRERWNG